MKQVDTIQIPPDVMLTSVYAELGIQFSLGGCEITPAEVFCQKGFLPLIMFYACARMRQYGRGELDLPVEYADHADGIFGKTVSFAPSLAQDFPLLKFVLAQISIDLLLDGTPLQYGLNANLDPVYEYFITPVDDREKKEWKPRNL